MRRFLRSLYRWRNRFRKGTVYGLSGWDLIRIRENQSTPALRRIPRRAWCDAIREVPLPKRGYDHNLDLDALLSLATRRVRETS